MILNHIKVGCAVAFMKYLAGVVSLIILRKVFIWNNFNLKLAELVVNELQKVITGNIYKNSF